MSEGAWLPLDPALRTAVRTALSLLFVAAALHKFGDVGAFRAAVADYRIVPEPFIAVVAVLLIGAELLLAAGLMATTGSAAAAAAAGLLAVYTAAIGVNLARGRRVDCGCFGPAARRPLGAALLFRNLVLLLLALVAGLSPAPRELLWVDTVTIAGCVAMLSITYLAFDTLIANTAALRAMRAGRRSEAASDRRLAPAPGSGGGR